MATNEIVVKPAHLPSGTTDEVTVMFDEFTTRALAVITATRIVSIDGLDVKLVTVIPLDAEQAVSLGEQLATSGRRLRRLFPEEVY